VKKFYRTVDANGNPDSQPDIPPGMYDLAFTAKRNLVIHNIDVQKNKKNKITVTDDEVGRSVIERARQMPGREKQVWDYYRNNANALAQLRAPIYEDKVVDFILELANVTEKKVSREELFKDDEEAEKTAA